MSVTPTTLRLEQALRDLLDATLDQQLRDLVAAWAMAWDETAPDLTDTLAELATQAAGGRIQRGMLVRSQRLTAALAAIAASLDTLASQANVRIVGDLPGVVRRAYAAQRDIIGSQLPYSLDQILTAPVRDRALAAIVRRSTEQITSLTLPLSDAAYDAVRRELIRGQAVGSNPNHTAKRMVQRAERGFNGGLARAINISRTESVDAHREAAKLGMDQHSEVLAGWVWMAHLSDRTCMACLGMHGTLHPLSEPGPLGHQQCVLPGAVVSGPRALASTTRWFEGEVVDIETVDGRRLSVTPNHPILTSHGWVPAGLLREGDDVVSGCIGERPAGGGRPDNYQVPALIEDVAQALGGATAVQAVCVPTAAEDFHGDGAGSDVHVVRTHGLLRGHGESSPTQLLRQPPLMVGDVSLEALASESGLALLLEGFGHSSRRTVRGLDVAPVLFRGAGRHHGSVGLKAAAGLHTCGLEAVLDRSARDAVCLSQRVDRFAGTIAFDDLLGRQVAFRQERRTGSGSAERVGLGSGSPQAALSQDAAQPFLAYPMPSSDDLAAFAGDVVTDRVLHVGRRSWSGHVYNLQTETGWFLANGVLTHNCRCARSPKTKSWAELGFPDLPEPVDHTPDADQFFATLSPAQQRAILGDRGYERWLAGDFPRSAWAVRRSNDGWRDAYYAAKPAC